MMTSLCSVTHGYVCKTATCAALTGYDFQEHVTVGSLHHVAMCVFHLQRGAAVAALVGVSHVLQLQPEVFLRGPEAKPRRRFGVFEGEVPGAALVRAVLVFVGGEKPQVPQRIVGV